jgi:hypothetical protein
MGVEQILNNFIGQVATINVVGSRLESGFDVIDSFLSDLRKRINGLNQALNFIGFLRKSNPFLRSERLRELLGSRGIWGHGFLSRERR